MSDKVKVKVTDHHFKSHFKVGDTTVNNNKPSEVEPNITVRNAVQAGTLELVEGDLTPQENEKQFRKDDTGREKGEAGDGQDLEELTVDELKEMCEEHDLKKTGTKDELVERLKNERKD